MFSIRKVMVVGLTGYASYGMAFVPTSSSEKGMAPAVPAERVIRTQTVAESTPRSFMTGESGRVEVDAKTGATRFIEGRLMAGQKALSISDKAIFENNCRDYILSHQDMFGVTKAQLSFEEKSALIDNDVQFVRFLVSRNGLMIEDATIECRYKLGQLVQVENHSFSEAAVAGGSHCSPINADQLLTGWVKSAADSYRVVETADGYELVLVKNTEVMHQGVRHRLQVEKATGNAFELKALEHYSSMPGVASASAYARYYKESQVDMPLSFAKLGDKVSADVDGKFAAEDALTMTGFNGKFLKMTLKSGTAPKVTSTRSNDVWSLRFKSPGSEAYSDKDMAQAMVYLHLTKKINHALKYIHPTWLDRPLQTNVNLTRTCNAYWDGSSVNFFSAGGGCANTGLISDVMYHEWGHGLHENTGGIKDRAFSEGFGDINAFVLTHDPVLGRGFKINDEKGIRDMSVPKVYPKDKGEEHAEGQIIASTFYDLYKGLEAVYGADKATDLISKYSYKGIYTAAKYTDMYKVALTIDDNDANPDNGTPNLCIINKAFKAHGLAEADARCLTLQ